VPRKVLAVPRLLPPPTGHPTPETSELIARIYALADAPYEDGEDRLTAIRDLHHLFDAASAAWEVAVARAAGEVETGATLQDIADVCGMDYGTIRDRAEKGRERVGGRERARLEAGMKARRSRGPRKS
jgi:hypothetical protein